MEPWYYKLICLFVGMFLGVLVMALCAMARCNDCETIERIRRGGK